jgi:hypothetical protein
VEKKLTVTGGILWIVGLILSIVGLNLEGGMSSGLAIAGNIVFLIGLGISGVAWIRRRNEEERAAAAQQPADHVEAEQAADQAETKQADAAQPEDDKRAAGDADASGNGTS